MSWKGILRRAGITVDSSGRIDPSAALYTAGGIPLVGTVFGDAYYVDYRNGSDDNSGTRRDKAFKTYSKAVASVTTNNNDVIFIDGDSTVVETAMVTLSKNRVHTVGINGPCGHYGAGAKISCALASGATNITTVLNTGVRNTFTGVKFMNENTVDEGLYGFVEGGEYSRFFGCEFYKGTDLDITGAADLVLNGDSPMFYNCTIGSSANLISGATIRANILLTQAIAGAGKVTRDAYFENCILWRRSSNVANRFVYGAAATDLERFMIMKNCLFANAKNATAVPAQNVAFGASLTVGEVLLWDCAALNAATAMSTTTGVFVLGSVPAAATTGIAVQAS